MKKILFSIVAGILLSSMPLAFAQDRAYVVSSVLDEVSQDKSWGSSLDGIERTTAQLMNDNRRLEQERESLSAEIAAYSMRIDSQRQKNESLLSAFGTHQRAMAVKPVTGDIQQQIARAEKEVLAVRPLVLSAQDRLKSADNKTGLARMKLEALQLEKQSLLLDRQGRSGSVLEILKQSVESLKDKVAAQKAQTDFIRQKIAELMRIDRPYLKEAQEYARDNAQIKNDLAVLSRERMELLAGIDAAVEKNSRAGVLPEMKKVHELIVLRQSLEGRIAAAQAKKKELSSKSEERVEYADSLSRQIREIEEENRQLESSMGNVRENIAVLEYRINTVTRYKNRSAVRK